ncbi:uncharacterized protein LOC124820773 [Vigna umbellata]|uniref:uncharacterized protein LOC124820773 n=1 Tax=Vigna umbellata TaxID=87088 RepID=UPI001F5FBD06|nr:uncharacterized protein LOC124820773 [Vigna umbellata]
MSSASVPDSVSYDTPKSKSLTELRPITGDKSDSDLNPSHLGGDSGKQNKRKRNDESQRRETKRHKAIEHFSSRRKEEAEKEKADVVPPSTMSPRLRDRGLESKFPIRDDHYVRHTDQTWPSKDGGRVHGDRHIPSSAHVISNAPSPPDTSNTTPVVQPSSSFSGKTPLPKPAPLQPPDKTLSENCKVDYHKPRMLEQNDEKHQKNKRVCEELVQRSSTIHGKQSGQVDISRLNLEDHTKKVQKSERNRCSTQDIASGFMDDNNTRDIQLHSNVETISEVPVEASEGKSREKGDKYMGTNDGSKQPANSVSVRNVLCDVKSESQFVHKSHVTGRNHLSKPRHTRDDVKSESQFVHKSHVTGRNHLSKPRHTRDDHILRREDDHILRREDKHILCREDDHILHREDDHILRREDDHILRREDDHILRREDEHILHREDDHILRREDKHILRSKGKHILPRGDKRAVSRKPLRPQGLYRPDINATLNAKSVELRKPGGKNPMPFACDTCHLKLLSRQGYDAHIKEFTHIRKVEEVSKRVTNLKQAVSDAINILVQRGDGNSALFVELLTTVLSKTQVTITEPAHTSVDGPSSEPQLLQSEIQAHVDIEDSSGKTKTELAVDVEIPGAPTSMAGPSYEAQLLQSQVSEIKARVEKENPSRETKPRLVVAAEILAPTSMTGPSCEPQLLQTQGSEIKTHVEMENASGATKAELAMAADIPSPASMSGPSYEPLLRTQASDTKAHVGIENPSGEIEIELAVTAEVPAPTSMTGVSHEPQLLKAQVSESKKHVEIENLSDETKTVTCPTEVKS